MSNVVGFNPLRWKCEKDGCFNQKHRLKFEAFYQALPGRISFSDVDGITEISGNALLLEWKDKPGSLPIGQRIMFENLTFGKRFSVICMAGDAESMAVSHCGGYFNGEWRPWQVATTADVNLRISRWADWAQRNPAPNPKKGRAA